MRNFSKKRISLRERLNILDISSFVNRYLENGVFGKLSLLQIIGLILLAVCTQTAFAAGDDNASNGGSESLLLDTLRENGTITQKQYERIQQQQSRVRSTGTSSAAQTDSGNESAVDRSAQQAADLNGLEVETKGGHLKVRSKDDAFEFEVGGRLMLDAAFFSTSDNPNTEGSEFGNGTEVRRARMYIAGKLYRDWQYKFQYDFTESGDSGIKDAFLQYDGFDLGDDTPVAVRLGNQFEWFGLAARTSSKYQVFMEQALPTQALTPGPRHLGLSVGVLHGPWVFGAGVFGAPPGDQTDLSQGSAGWSGDARVVYDPVLSKTELLHFGLSARYHQYESEPSIGNRNDGVFAARPGAHLADPLIAARVADSRPDHEDSYNAEFAAIKGPFSLQAEYFLARISGVHNVDESSPVFDGYYALASWLLTGESRHYVHTPQYANFAQVHPSHPLNEGGYGAWELDARIDNADLNDGDVRGGDQTDLSLGLNWYPVNNLRFETNYVHALDVDGGPYDGLDYDAFIARAQVYF